MSPHCSPQAVRPGPLLASLRLEPSRVPSGDAQSMPAPGAQGHVWGPCPSSPARGPTHLVVVHHCDVHGRLLGLAKVDDRVLLGAWHAAGGQDLVVLVHAQRLPAQVLHGKGLAVGQGDSEGRWASMKGEGGGSGWGLGRAESGLTAVAGCPPRAPTSPGPTQGCLRGWGGRPAVSHPGNSLPSGL